MKYTGRIYLSLIAIFSWAILIYFMYQEYRRIDFVFYIATAGYTIFGWWLGKQYDIARFYSDKDSLTKVYNRRFIFETLSKLIGKCDRYKIVKKREIKNKSLCLFVIDVDQFKKINDTYGHVKGDLVLKCVADVLMHSIRKTDFVGRWGGDEFIIIAPFVEKSMVPIITKRIEAELENLSNELQLNVTLSIGIAIYPEDTKSIEELIKIADNRMYEAKLLKKNYILGVFAQSPEKVD
jgi:diguanylate cyclase (GGDEF)-like protein